MMSLKRTQGFTLIEVVLAIVIIGTAVVVLSSVLIDTTDRNIEMESTNVAVLLARDTMSQVMAQDYDNVVDVASTGFGGDFGDYSYVVSVDYVEADDLDTSVVGPTDYKRVVVTVSWRGRAVQLNNLKVNL